MMQTLGLSAVPDTQSSASLRGCAQPTPIQEESAIYLTSEKVAVHGRGRGHWLTLVQFLLASRTANRIAMHDPYLLGLEGAAEEV